MVHSSVESYKELLNSVYLYVLMYQIQILYLEYESTYCLVRTSSYSYYEANGVNKVTALLNARIVFYSTVCTARKPEGYCGT